MSDVLAAEPLWGVRCTDPDPIGHQLGRICAQSQDRHRMWSLAIGEPCYELVVSRDGGETWASAER